MTILDEIGGSVTITEGWRALELFTNRYTPIRRFLTYVNDERPRRPILFFHGDGGNGKSLLLRVLREQYCVYFSHTNWEYIKETFKQDKSFVEETKRALGTKPILAATIDFAPQGDELSQEPFTALLMLRRSLSGHGLQFPIFDFACLWYLDQTKRLSSERLSNLFPDVEMDFIMAMADAIEHKLWFVPVGAILKLMGKHSKKQFTMFMKQRKVNEDMLNQIQTMEPRDLFRELPYLFATDLNMNLGVGAHHKRIVLFFDSYEAFWGYDKGVPTAVFYERDEWLRRLLLSLETSSGIRVVLAGREAPQWANATTWQIPAKYIDNKTLQELSRSDALIYLDKAGIEDKKMRDCLVRYAKVTNSRVHPLLLGLCADVILLAAEQGESLTPQEFRRSGETTLRVREIIDKLLSYAKLDVRYAIRALSACRSFDKEIYYLLGQAIRFHPTESSFELLTQFSFVWRSPGASQYRIHDLLRRLFFEQADEVTRKADEFLESYFRKLVAEGEPLQIIGAIYHAYRLDWKKGVAEWLEIFDQALDESHHDLTHALIELTADVLAKDNTDAGRMSESIANYFLILGRYDESRQKHNEAIAFYDRALRGKANPEIYDYKGLALSRLGDLYEELSMDQLALKSYHKALKSLDTAMMKLPNDPDPPINKAATLSSIAELQFKLSNYKAASRTFAQSLECYEVALRIAPDYVDTYLNKSETLIGLAEMESELSQYEKAAETLCEAVAVCDAALHFRPGDLTALTNKAAAMQGLGDVQCTLMDFTEAGSNYKQALELYDKILERAANDVIVLANKATTFVGMAHMYSTLSRYEKSVSCFEKGLKALDDVHKLAAGDLSALSLRVEALEHLGRVRVQQGHYPEALHIYNQAIAVCDEGINRSPADKVLRTRRANIQGSLSELQSELGDNKQAIASLKEAASRLQEVLRDAPEEVTVLENQAIAFRQLGEIYTEIADYDLALDYLWQAISMNEKVLQVASNDLVTLDEQGESHKKLGNLHLVLSQNDQATEQFEEALKTFGRMLKLVPDHFSALVGRGDAFAGLGEVNFEKSRYRDAINDLERAMAEYERSLKSGPHHEPARLGIASAMVLRGEILTQLSEYDEAIKSFTEGLRTYETVAKSKGPPSTSEEIGNILLKLGNLQADLGRYVEARHAYQRALKLADDVLLIGKGRDTARAIKACALHGLSYVQAQLSEHAAAKDNFTRATSIFDDLIQHYPDDFSLRFNQAEVFFDLAEVEAHQSNYEEADGFYRRALDSCDVALGQVPTDITVLLQKAETLRGLGDLQADLSQHEEAMIRYQQSMDQCSQALSYAPNNTRALTKKAEAYRKLATVRFETSEETSADQFSEVAALCDRALTIAHNNIDAKLNKAWALLYLSKLHPQDNALTYLEKTNQLVSDCIKLAPQRKDVKELNNVLVPALKAMKQQ